MDNEAATFELLQLRLVIDKFGATRYYNHENELHRKFGPAIIWRDGDKTWYLNGLLHRTDGPAVEFENGDKCWYINDIDLTEKDFLKHPFCTIK